MMFEDELGFRYMPWQGLLGFKNSTHNRRPFSWFLHTREMRTFFKVHSSSAETLPPTLARSRSSSSVFGIPGMLHTAPEECTCQSARTQGGLPRFLGKELARDCGFNIGNNFCNRK